MLRYVKIAILLKSGFFHSFFFKKRLFRAIFNFSLFKKTFGNPNQPLFDKLYNINQMRSKFMGYKVNLKEIKNKECPLFLKIVILKSMRNNLILMIKQNKQLIKERKVIGTFFFEKNLTLK